MVRTIIAFSCAALLAACASPGTNAVQADLPVAKGTAMPGAGHSVDMKGQPLALAGQPISIGEKLPDAMVTGVDLKPVNLGVPTGKVRIISVVPSIDTPVCDKQTHELSEDGQKLAGSDVQMLTVSMDLPFAQKRFSKEAKIGNVTFVSDYKDREFGERNGLLIKPLGLLARAVIVTDKNNVVRYMQVVPEITALPDMDAAMSAAKRLM